jgi:Zn-dependent protease with chaperone function
MVGDLRLQPLHFHDALASALQEAEPGLWRWFASDTYGQKYADTVKVELLRSTYRLPRDSNAKLYAMGEEIAQGLGIEAPLTLYQAQEDGALNAGLVFVPSDAHVVLRGPVTDILSEAELRALFGHELAHHKLWTEGSGKYRIAESLVERIVSQTGSAPSYVQSALRHRRWTEIYADRGSLLACGDLLAAIGCLVKMSTGLRQVDAKAYLDQAEETIAAKADSGRGSTHPEAFVRAFALRAWHTGESDEVVRELVEGPLELDALDLVQQRALLGATEQLLKRVLSPAWMRTEATLAHARRFFPELAFTGEPSSFEMPSGESLAEYVAYVLLDFAMADAEIEEASLAYVAHVGRELGIASALAKIARKELRLSAATYADLEKQGREFGERADLPGATTQEAGT